MGKNRFARGLPLITAWIPPCPRQLQSFAKLVVRLLPLANGSIAYAFVFEVTEPTRFFRCQGGLSSAPGQQRQKPGPNLISPLENLFAAQRPRTFPSCRLKNSQVYHRAIETHSPGRRAPCTNLKNSISFRRASQALSHTKLTKFSGNPLTSAWAKIR